MNERVSSERSWWTAIWLSALTWGVAGSIARAGDYYVDPSGANGAYPTIQAAITAVSGQSASNRANIYVAPGVYTEQPNLAKPWVSVIGQGALPSDVKLTFSGVPNVPPTSFGATFTVTTAATGFMATNMTFENSIPDQNRTQALAARIQADRSIVSNCRFLGYQDTILLDRGSRQYLVNSFITGDTDFIYGDATAVLDRCTIESTDRGYITAANTARSTANGLIIMDSTLVPGSDRNPAPNGLDDGTSANNNTVNLGRPWQWTDPTKKPSTIYLRTKMGPHIKSTGWDPWNSTGTTTTNPDPDGVSRYSEFGSMDLAGNPLPIDPGTGMPDGRYEWADPMTAAQAANYTLANIFGGIDTIDFWNTAGTQPEGTGVTYVDNRAAWDPLAQLAQLPAVPEPGSAATLLVAGGLTALQRRRRAQATQVTRAGRRRRLSSTLLIAIVLGATARLSAPARAAIWTIDPTQDTYIDAGPLEENTNYGASALLRARWSTFADNYISFLRFSLPSDMGPGATIHSATITVSGETATNNDTKRIQVAGLVESFDNWSESTLTHANSDTQAGVDTSPTASAPGFVAGALTGTFLSDVATGVDWESGVQRQTFSLRGNGDAFRDFVFADSNDSITLVLLPVSTTTYQSDESPSAHRPILSINYTPAAVPEPSSLALLVLAGTASMRRRSGRD